MSEKLYYEIHAERRRQVEQWGGFDHDDTHQPNDWIAYIAKQLGMAAAASDVVEWRERMVKIAALAVAAAESGERVAESRLGAKEGEAKA